MGDCDLSVTKLERYVQETEGDEVEEPYQKSSFVQVAFCFKQKTLLTIYVQTQYCGITNCNIHKFFSCEIFFLAVSLFGTSE